MVLAKAAAVVAMLAAACSPRGAEAINERRPDSGAEAVSSAASSQDVSRPCSLASVSGIWSLIHIEADEPGVQDFYAQAPYEFLRFSPDSRYAYFATRSALNDVNQIDQGINRADEADGADFRVQFRNDGAFLITRDGQPFQIFECQIAGRAGQGGAQPGDMIWTNAEGMARLYRVHRRLR